MTVERTINRLWALIDILADGRFHSGEALARQLGISRASVFNALEKTDNLGISLQRVRGRGYKLCLPWDRLQSEEVMRLLGEHSAKFNLEIMAQAPSSNTILLQRAALGAPGGSVLAAELQTAGRGRRGKAWHSELGSALTFSLLWRFESGLNSLSGLSLAVGVAVVRALNKLSINDIQLKWPNDIFSQQGKLGGVLIEAQGDMLGPSSVVIGIGLNYNLPGSLAQRIDQPASALSEICESLPQRNRLLAAILCEQELMLSRFAQYGFAPLRQEWERYHIYQNQQIQMQMPDGSTVTGLVNGVSDSGELHLETKHGSRKMNSGEVEVRR